VHNRYLKRRLQRSTEWVEFDAQSDVQPLFDGVSNVADSGSSTSHAIDEEVVRANEGEVHLRHQHVGVVARTPMIAVPSLLRSTSRPSGDVRSLAGSSRRADRVWRSREIFVKTGSNGISTRLHTRAAGRQMRCAALALFLG
jgi:hypothetical protein